MSDKALAAVPARGVIADMAARFGMDKDAFERTLRATVVPENTSKEQFAAFLLVAKEYNLNPVIKQIYAFPGKSGGIQPIVSIDGWIHMATNHPEFDGMEFDDRMEDGKLTAITCRMYRKDRSRPVEVTEYMSECRRETDTWKRWPARMLRHRATIQCARYAFGFSGIYDEDEAQRIVNVTDSSQVTERQPLTAQVRRASEARQQPVEDADPGYTLAEVIAIANGATDDDGIAYARSLLSSLSEADAEKAREAIDQRAADLTDK